MTRKKLGTKVLITLLDKRWESVHKASLGFLEGDMNENMLITYIAPDLIMPIKEFIDKMVFAFQTKGYEDFKGTNLLVSIEFIGRLTNRRRSQTHAFDTTTRRRRAEPKATEGIHHHST